MCSSRERAPARPRPRWSRLYTIVSLPTMALALIELTVAPSPLRTASEAAIVLAIFGAMAMWVRANRVALGQLERCPCGSERLTVRVIRSRPVRPSRLSAAAPLSVATPVSAPAEHRTGARLGT